MKTLTITRFSCPSGEYIVQTDEDGRLLDMQSCKNEHAANVARNLLMWTLDALGYEGRVLYKEVDKPRHASTATVAFSNSYNNTTIGDNVNLKIINDVGVKK